VTGELEFYGAPGRMTDLASVAEHVETLPSTLPEICEVVQGLVLHPFWAERYGVGGVAERDDELQLRKASDILAKALEIDGRPLDVAREPGKRVLGNCRDFTTVTTALLRSKGVPARGRCGFGIYFDDGKFIDHWVVEWWDGTRWIRTDSQLDAFQQKELNLTFDPLDMPSAEFLEAGRAWQLYRSGEADGDTFGVLDMWGPWFIRGNIPRDIASLNKVEMLPWDGWGIDGVASSLADEDIDPLAAVSADADFLTVRELYESDERVRVGDEVTSYLPSGPVKVRV
jgi:hypothetical protein